LFLVREETKGKVDKRLGFVGIIVEDRKKAAHQVNDLLSKHGDIIVARVGLPYRERKCSVITLIVDATTDELGALTGKLGALEGVSVKSALTKA
jgi:putative iron-only hydrogenase system regulator